jgi:hypothetical protein
MIMATLSACGGGSTASGTPSPSAGSVKPSASATAPATPAALTADSRIKSVQFATAIAPDGGPQNPTTTFHATTDSKIIAVIALDVPVGTQLSFIRYIGGAYVDSRTAVVPKPAKYFYFEFTAATGKTFTPGQYRLRLYVDGHATTEVGYQIG